ncbi:hypothetical protein [Glutamicibacter endophyticus]|uniref:hypothetical protein n=1 Tax=Glutamicibacter endophyticus TaxID=1522174 RepID=UPI003AF1CA5D
MDSANKKLLTIGLVIALGGLLVGYALPLVTYAFFENTQPITPYLGTPISFITTIVHGLAVPFGSMLAAYSVGHHYLGTRQRQDSLQHDS